MKRYALAISKPPHLPYHYIIDTHTREVLYTTNRSIAPGEIVNRGVYLEDIMLGEAKETYKTTYYDTLEQLKEEAVFYFL